MKHHKAHQIIPALIMAGTAAVPVVTTVEILTHVPGGGSAIALPSSAPVAAAPPKTSPQRSSGPNPASSGGTRTLQGPVVNGPFGAVQATITLSGKKITNVAISAPQDNPRSAGINQQAVPYLQSETLQAQSAQINGVSGATITSQAYAQSLQGALTQAQSQGNSVAGGQTSSTGTAGASAGTAQSPSVSTFGDD